MRMSPRHLSVPALAGLLGAAAAACGGGSSPQATTATTQAAARSSSSSGTGAPPGPPGVSGQVAAVNGSVLEVQDPTSGQTTVNLNGTTVITQTVTVGASALAVGQCVTASGRKTSGGPVAATMVTINALASGSCTGPGAFGGGAGAGGPGGFGGRRFGTGGTGGSTTRTTLSAAQRAQRQAQLANIGVSDGRITAIDGSTVEVAVPPPPSTTSTTNTTRPGEGPRFRITPAASFTYGSSTQFLETRSATASVLAVGQCVTAFGPADTTGAVTAQRLSIRPAGPNGCSAGFGGGGFGRFGGGADGGAGTGGTSAAGTGG